MSDTLGRFIAHLDATEALSGKQVCELVGFLKRHLPQLRAFAADCEFAEAITGDVLPEKLLAMAATRLIGRMRAPATPLIAARPASPPALVIDWSKYRRPPIDGGAA
jgi:hypothetical protein